MELKDKTIIVTGGASGIGRGISAVLADRGADVVIADLDIAAANDVADGLRGAGHRAAAIDVDVTSRASADAMVEAALSEFGRVDTLINNAGVGGADGWWRRDTPTLADWDATFGVNVLGIVHASEAVQEHMKERRSGKIVNIASVAGRQGQDGFAHYSASKASAINVTQAFAIFLGPFTINVNCICPGLIWTPLWDKIAERHKRAHRADESMSTREVFLERVKARTPLGREQTPEDVGKLAAFLCSDRARNITGQSINLNGGSLMS